MARARLSAGILLATNLLILIQCPIGNTRACRVNSESLKSFTRTNVERLLDVQKLESIYWPDDPLDASLLTRAIGLNVTIAETYFQLRNEVEEGAINKSIGKTTTADNKQSHDEPLIRDMFLTCSADRDRTYALTINLELTNPFKVIEVLYEMQPPSLAHGQSSTGNGFGVFRIHLPQSTFLVQLVQRIKYDQCLSVNYVQLAPNMRYEIECLSCNEEQQAYLDRIFSKKVTQLDEEFDSMLSEKLLLGLQTILSEQRLELDLFMNN